MTIDSLRTHFPEVPGSGGARARLSRLARAFYERLAGKRLLFSLAICVLVSTQFLFQPQLFEAFSLSHLLWGWLDYFAECLLMGMPIAIALTMAEVGCAGRGRITTAIAGAVALVAGAFAGALLLIPFYDLGWESLRSRRFWSDMAYWIAIGGGVATIYGLQQRAATAAAALHRVQVDQVALAKQMLEARLQVMRAQIEPHFLFNTLANVKRLCQTDVEGGITMLDNLALYLRAALPRMREAQTTLGQEADLVAAYLAVLQIRMGNRLRYAIDIPPSLRPLPFPPMMLLTLAENAVKHGLNPAPAGGMLLVRAEQAGDMVAIKVADSGVGFGVAATGGTGIGLANTRARLAALYGDTAELALAANEPTGVLATIRVPRAAGAPSTLAQGA